MLFSLIEFAAGTTWFMAKQSYYMGSYLIYGSREDEIMRELNKQRKEIRELREVLQLAQPWERLDEDYIEYYESFEKDKRKET